MISGTKLISYKFFRYKKADWKIVAAKHFNCSIANIEAMRQSREPNFLFWLGEYLDNFLRSLKIYIKVTDGETPTMVKYSKNIWMDAAKAKFNCSRRYICDLYKRNDTGFMVWLAIHLDDFLTKNKVLCYKENFS